MHRGQEIVFAVFQNVIVVGNSRSYQFSYPTFDNDVVEHYQLKLADIRGGGLPIPKWRTHGIPYHVGSAALEYGYVTTPVAAQFYYSYTQSGTVNPEGAFLLKVNKL